MRIERNISRPVPKRVSLAFVETKVSIWQILRTILKNVNKYLKCALNASRKLSILSIMTVLNSFRKLLKNLIKKLIVTKLS